MNEKEILKKYKDYLVARKFSLCYPNYISLFLKYCKEQNINYDNINQGILTDFLNHDKYSANTVNLFIKAGRSWNQFLCTPNDKNEWLKIKYVRTPKRKPDCLTEEDLKKIIKYICTYENRLITPVKADALICFMYYTGLRREELLTLKRENIDLNFNPCSLKIMGKGAKERWIYFSDKYSPKLKEKLINYFNSELEIDNAFNLTLSKLNYLVKKMNKCLTDRTIHPHLFRHSFARCLVDKGVPLTYVARVLGDSLQVAQIYVDPTENMVKAYF